MSITSLSDRAVTLLRRTAILFGPAPATASMTTAFQPSGPAKIRVRLAGGTAATGTITVHGTVDGSPATEVLTFAGPDVFETIQRFSALASPAFTSAGLADEATPPTTTITAVNPAGEVVSSLVELATSWPWRKGSGLNRWPGGTQGATESAELLWYVDANSVFEPREGDEIVDGSDRWVIVGNPDARAGGRRFTHHWECRTKLVS